MQSTAVPATASNNLEREQARTQVVSAEIRQQFREIISKDSFIRLCVSCAELFAEIGKAEPAVVKAAAFTSATTAPNNINSLSPLIEKLQPIMESFFIIFRIVHDEDFDFLKKPAILMLSHYHAQQSQHEYVQ